MVNIYKIVNLVNNKIYVGKTKKSIEQRLKDHQKNAGKYNRYFCDAMYHHGISNFNIELIEKVEDSFQDLKEKFWISFYNSNNPIFGYNMNSGGGGGDHMKGRSMKGKTCYDKWLKEGGITYAEAKKKEMYAKISFANKGKKGMIWTKEQKENLSKKLKEIGHRPPPNRMFGKDHPMFNKTHSIEARKKISEARFGKTYEEIFGKDKAQSMKLSKIEKFSGANNPLYREFDILKNLDFILNSKNLRKDCKEIFNIAYVTVLDKFKKYFNKTITEYKNEKKLP